MTLPDLYRAARSLESIENYVRSDDPLLQETNSTDDRWVTDASVVYSVVYDDEFWKPKLVESSRNAKEENQSNNSFRLFWICTFRMGCESPRPFLDRRG